jgi:predicted membrane protein
MNYVAAIHNAEKVMNALKIIFIILLIVLFGTLIAGKYEIAKKIGIAMGATAGAWVIMWTLKKLIYLKYQSL